MERRHKHFAAMRAMRLEGKTCAEVAAVFGFDPSRISQILGPKSGLRMVAGPARLTTPEQDDEMLVLYKAGYTLSEIASRYGLSRVTVRARIDVTGEYEPRRFRGTRNRKVEVVVPRWVPDRLGAHYSRLCHSYDEHIAASCVRTAKRLGVSV